MAKRSRVTVAVRYHDPNLNRSRTFIDERKAQAYVQDVMRNRIDIRAFSVSDSEQVEVYSGRGQHLFTLGKDSLASFRA